MLRQGGVELLYGFHYLKVQSVPDAVARACSHDAIAQLLGGAVTGLGGAVTGEIL